MNRFPDVKQSIFSRIDRSVRNLSRLGSAQELQDQFILEAGKVLPADCLCWNDWSPDFTRLLGFGMNDEYQDRFETLLEPFNEVVAYHPVIVAEHLATTAEDVMRMSDFQGISRFKDNPLFREVYRHLDSHYQISFTASILEKRRVVITWNRRLADFDNRDRQVFHYLGFQLGALTRQLDEKLRLESAWHSLSELVGLRVGIAGVQKLSVRDLEVLTSLLKGQTRNAIARSLGAQRNTIDKQFGSIREKLGLKSQSQLLGALAALGKRNSTSE